LLGSLNDPCDGQLDIKVKISRNDVFRVVTSFVTSFGTEGRKAIVVQQFPREKPLFATRMNTGGEDFGYFAPGDAGSTPACDQSCRGIGPARAGASRAASLSQEDSAF
jgi:hypothetical protein